MAVTESTKSFFLAWLKLELVGALFFFTFFDWADLISAACLVLDPDGEEYYDCDPEAPDELRTYTKRRG